MLLECYRNIIGFLHPILPIQWRLDGEGKENGSIVKISGAFAFSLALYLIVDFSFSWASEFQIFTKADSGSEVTVKVGEVIWIELEQAGATGYLWESHDLDTQHFEVLGVETRTNVKPEITGAPLFKIWSIRAIKEGKSNLRFLYYRPWEGDKSATDNFVLKVVIIQ